MKRFLPLILLFINGFTYSQKYLLVDKKMFQPVRYSNSVTVQDNFNGYFAIEHDNINALIAEIDKIAKKISDAKQKKESFNFKVGNTKIIGLLISEAGEERLDVVLITEGDQAKTILHLCDRKLDNATNATYINTLVKYIRSSLPN